MLCKGSTHPKSYHKPRLSGGLFTSTSLLYTEKWSAASAEFWSRARPWTYEREARLTRLEACMRQDLTSDMAADLPESSRVQLLLQLCRNG